MRIEISTRELCQQADISTETVIEIVEHGIVHPRGNKPEEWVFTIDYLWTIRRAARLHYDLGIDWAGIALAMELIEERDRLKRENELLRRRLGRFEE